MRLPSVGALAAAITTGSTAGTRTRNGFVLRQTMHPDWVRDLRDQVHAANGAFFLKQVGSNHVLWPGVKHRKGENPIEWPRDLQIRDFPR
jgi:hypothetical protein